MVDIVDLRNLVAEAEGTTDERAAQENFASGYDLPFGYGRYLQPSKPISQMTFQELADFQRRQVNATKGTFDNTNLGTSAVGRYQFIGPTLKNLKNRLGYKDTDVFSPEVQDRLFDALMEEKGLQEFLSGLMTPEEFQEKLSSQFASIPKPGTETGTYKGQRTGVTSDRVSAVLSSMQDPSGGDDTFRPEDDTVPSDTGTVTGDQAEEESGFLDTVGEYVGDAYDTVSEYAGDAYDTASEYVGETVDTLERVAESVGDKLRRLLGLEEEQQSSTTVDNPPIPERRPVAVDNPPIPEPRPNQTKKSSFAEDLYSLATTGSRQSARKLRDMVAQQLGVYESSQEATSEAKKYKLNEREVDTLRHILGAGLLKYIGKDFTQPLLQGTELFEKIPIYAQRLLDPDSEDTYRKSYYDQSIEEANIDIVNYQVGAALAKQYDTKDDFIKSAVKLVKDLGEGKTPVVVDKMPTRFGLVDRELTPRLSTGVVYPPEELKRRNLIYNPDKGTLTAPPAEDYGFVEPAPGSNLEDQGPAVLEKAEGGSVEKEVEFVKEDDDDVPDPPPGATPEEVADDIPAYLSTGEYVLPANVVRYIGLKNITDMHQRALAELQQMEDLDIIENVDENGYVEEDDDEMDYMEPEEAGVVEIVVAEHHPKGLMAMGFAEGGMINSDSSMEEGQVLPTSDIFSEGVYAQANIDRSVDSEDVVESDKVITAPVAFSSAPGKTAYLAYITPEEAASLRQAKQGFSSEGNGQEVSDGQYQHLGPKGLMSFNGVGGPSASSSSEAGDEDDATDPGVATGPSATSSSGAVDEDDATDPGAATAAQAESPLGGMIGAINEALGFERAHGFAGLGVTDVDETTGEVFGPMGLQSVARSYTEKDVRDPKSVATAVGMGLGSIAGGLAGIGQAAVNAAIEAGVDVQEASTNDIGGGSQEFYEEEKADTDTEKTTDTDPLSDYIYVPGVGYRRKVKSVKPLSKLKAGGYVSKKGIMAKGYDTGGDVGDPGGGPGGPLEREPEPEVVEEEEKPTDPYEGYTYVKGIGYVPTSRRMTSDKPVDAASLALSSIFTPDFLETIGLMSDPNKEL